MSAEYNPEADLEICCSCEMCQTGRALKRIPEPTQAEQVAAISRLEADKRRQFAEHVADDPKRLQELVQKLAPQIAAARMSVGTGRTLSEALADALKRATPEKPKLSLEEQEEADIKAAFEKLKRFISNASTFLSDNNKELALMRIREAELLWEDT